MADTVSSPIRPDDLWRAFGRNLAASAGALSALLSLLSGSSVTTACFRGSLALFGVLLVTRIGAAALAGIESLEAKSAKAANSGVLGEAVTDEESE